MKLKSFLSPTCLSYCLSYVYLIYRYADMSILLTRYGDVTVGGKCSLTIKCSDNSRSCVCNASIICNSSSKKSQDYANKLKEESKNKYRLQNEQLQHHRRNELENQNIQNDFQKGNAH